MTATSPLQTKDASNWSNWFWTDFFKDWLHSVQDGQHGVFDALNEDGTPDNPAEKSLLAQARTLFTVSHAALLLNDPTLIAAAQTQAAFLGKFRMPSGLYRNTTTRDGHPTGQPLHDSSRSYDLSFVILALVTWNRLSPSNETAGLIDDCWTALQTHLVDPKTGLLRNDDMGVDLNPAQNPHMHLYEACLQAYRMTHDDLWLNRAADLRVIGLKHFMDSDDMDLGRGSITEFLTPKLTPLPGDAGCRREVGHQCEWAWLLLEEADLAQNPSLKVPATALMAFADANGFAPDGPVTGAAYDAISTDGTIMEHTFLLWPQTEAIKIFARHHTAGDPDAGKRARDLLCLMFERWFLGRATYVNRLDEAGQILWPQALTRLMYHIVLALSEGARAGLWPTPPRNGTPARATLF